ncbi:restriction endonuclease [Clostridium folliculivorans]|uniref:restriction endonuclease n=1 Tax=Clostridium folliculivorans TaxID=2886038 RepID=UPI0021C390E4|nr:restriction endonuclease [Clostridium folliculivorans]GKU30431.1 restriction endonuclease [Clostridium folliculivorans]
MKNDQIRYGSIKNIWNVDKTKVLRYQQEIWHDGLKDHKVLTAPDKSILENKVRVQIDKWNEKWNIICEKKLIENETKAGIEEATNRTIEAESELKEVENILLSILDISSAVDWEVLKKKEDFKVHSPIKPSLPKYLQMPVEPDKNSKEFQPRLTFLSKFFEFLRNKAISKSEDIFKAAYESWQEEYKRAKSTNNQIKSEYSKVLANYNKEFEDWENKKAAYYKKQTEYNTKIDELRSRYHSHDVSAVLEYCEIVLNKSLLPEFVHKNFEIDYNPNSKILIVDYMLPNIEDFPNIKEVKYVTSKKELKTTYQTTSFMEKLFDATVYKLILRILHEEFEADVANAIDAISLNGLINYLNKATGKYETACIASIQVKKEYFNLMNLEKVDAKDCFKNLKGIGSSKLAGITPIKPILTINKNDKRFIDSYNVTQHLDNSTNLAAIPWEDFEHLIRELFENEFSSNGGEVKVTQASRDGGVDAIAFDPDPIRGGKIVIQAKRYTNTVGVSAVRDLYGTVMNEGATKGILVTTADYGPDAYEFAKNKPLTLLNGGNLLHLLEKHGHKAKIDLKEAKALNLAKNA